MIENKDPIPTIIRLMKSHLSEAVYGNTFPENPRFPSLLVKQAGGNGYFRIQLIARAEEDYAAMETLTEAMNILERFGTDMKDLRVTWVERESNPISSADHDTGKPEAWCYMRVESLEA